MTGSRLHRGGCLCGAIRYEAHGEHANATICHCESCRRAAGALSVAWITVALDELRWIKGWPAEYRSSEKVRRTFCPGCGTSLTYHHADAPAWIDVTVGSLDEPGKYPPADDTWVGDAVRYPSDIEHRPRYLTTRAARITSAG